jgi:16S rRNA (uracil1498-N3)-methyltransferase
LGKQANRDLKSKMKRRSEPTSNTYRFFVAPESFQGDAVHVADAALVKQLSTVLRLRAGDVVTLLDNSGAEYSVVLDAIERRDVRGTITAKTIVHTEPRLQVAIYVALIRNERFEWVLQKGTELGVSTFMPVVCERSVVDDLVQVKERKLDRWERIVREAAEQSRRAKLPTLHPAMLFTAACEHAARHAHAVLLHPESTQGDGAASLTTVVLPLINRVTTDPQAVAVLSGPEGGFSPDEVRTAQRYGVRLATLGPRTLRAETAPIAATAALLFAYGDLG